MEMKIRKETNFDNPYDAPWNKVTVAQGIFKPNSLSPIAVLDLNTGAPLFFESDSFILTTFMVAKNGTVTTGGQTVSVGTSATNGGAIVTNIMPNNAGGQAQLDAGYLDEVASGSEVVGDNSFISALLSGAFSAGTDEYISVLIIYTLSLKQYGNVRAAS